MREKADRPRQSALRRSHILYLHISDMRLGYAVIERGQIIHGLLLAGVKFRYVRLLASLLASLPVVAFYNRGPDFAKIILG